MSTILSRGSGGGEEGKNGFLPVGACAVALEQFWVQEGRGGGIGFLFAISLHASSSARFSWSLHIPNSPPKKKKGFKKSKETFIKKGKGTPRNETPFGNL